MAWDGRKRVDDVLGARRLNRKMGESGLLAGKSDDDRRVTWREARQGPPDWEPTPSEQHNFSGLNDRWEFLPRMAIAE